MKPPLTAKKFDDFQTPGHAVDPLLRFLKKDWTVWECSQGKGNLTRAFEAAGYTVVGSDILTGQDFLTWQPTKWDVVVTNPPYSLKQQFLQRAYNIGKPFAFLLPLTALETRVRQTLFHTNGIEVILFDRRLNFEMPPGTVPDHRHHESKSWFTTCWITNGLNIGRQLTFVHVTKNGQTEMF